MTDREIIACLAEFVGVQYAGEQLDVWILPDGTTTAWWNPLADANDERIVLETARHKGATFIDQVAKQLDNMVTHRNWSDWDYLDTSEVGDISRAVAEVINEERN